MSPDNVVKLVEAFEAEINNGGFDQFFFNSTGDAWKETLEALDCIAALKTAAILREACSKFPDGDPPSDCSDRRNLMLDSISINGDEFNDLDEQFYCYEESLDELVTSYRSRKGL
jgi:hypothetical protein